MMETEDAFNRLADKRNLYLVSQTANNDYDTYSDFVIAAWTEEEARNTHPNGELFNLDTGTFSDNDYYYSQWTLPINVSVELVGVAEPGISGVICHSYHAG